MRHFFYLFASLPTYKYMIITINSHYPLRNAGRFGRVIVTTKDGDRNMLRADVFRELRQLDDIIQNSTVTYDGETFTYKDACARWENECFANDILNLDHIIKDVSQLLRCIYYIAGDLSNVSECVTKLLNCHSRALSSRSRLAS